MPYLERDIPYEGVIVLMKCLIELTHAQFFFCIHDRLTTSLCVFQWSAFGGEKITLICTIHESSGSCVPDI